MSTINRFFSQPPSVSTTRNNASSNVGEKSASDEAKDKLAQFASTLPMGLRKLSDTAGKVMSTLNSMNADPAKKEVTKDACNRVESADTKITSIIQNPHFKFEGKPQISQENFKAKVQQEKVAVSEPELSDSTPRLR